MKARAVGIAAGIVCGLGWLAKMAIMAGQGGPDPDSVTESIAFLTGLAGVVVATAALGVHVTRDRSIVIRVLAAAAALVVVSLVVGMGQFALTALPGESWVREEAIFGLVGLAALVTATAAMRRRAAHEVAA